MSPLKQKLTRFQKAVFLTLFLIVVGLLGWREYRLRIGPRIDGQTLRHWIFKVAENSYDPDFQLREVEKEILQHREESIPILRCMLRFNNKETRRRALVVIQSVLKEAPELTKEVLLVLRHWRSDPESFVNVDSSITWAISENSVDTLMDLRARISDEDFIQMVPHAYPIGVKPSKQAEKAIREGLLKQDASDELINAYWYLYKSTEEGQDLENVMEVITSLPRPVDLRVPIVVNHIGNFGRYLRPWMPILTECLDTNSWAFVSIQARAGVDSFSDEQKAEWLSYPFYDQNRHGKTRFVTELVLYAPHLEQIFQNLKDGDEKKGFRSWNSWVLDMQARRSPKIFEELVGRFEEEIPQDLWRKLSGAFRDTEYHEWYQERLIAYAASGQGAFWDIFQYFFQAGGLKEGPQERLWEYFDSFDAGEQIGAAYLLLEADPKRYSDRLRDFVWDQYRKAVTGELIHRRENLIPAALCRIHGEQPQAFRALVEDWREVDEKDMSHFLKPLGRWVGVLAATHPPAFDFFIETFEFVAPSMLVPDISPQELSVEQIKRMISLIEQIPHLDPVFGNAADVLNYIEALPKREQKAYLDLVSSFTDLRALHILKGQVSEEELTRKVETFLLDERFVMNVPFDEEDKKLFKKASGVAWTVVPRLLVGLEREGRYGRHWRRQNEILLECLDPDGEIAREIEANWAREAYRKAKEMGM